MKRCLLACMLLLSACAAMAINRTQTRLVLSLQSARPGQTIWAGLEMKMPPDWHVYWTNGGDAGSAPTLEWHLPKGVTAGEIQWPIPRKMVDKVSDETTIVTYVYSNTVVLPVALKLDAALPPGPLDIKATAHWQECADICVMAHEDDSTTLNIGAETKESDDAAEIEQWRKKLPDGAGAASVSWDGAPRGPKADSRALLIDWTKGAEPADFYPYANTDFDVSGLTEDLHAPNSVRLRKGVHKGDGANWPSRVAGILVGKVGTPDEFATTLDAPIAATAATSPTKSAAPVSLVVLLAKLGAALLGGLILNVMPCVLPVIALKVLGFVNQSKEHPRRVRQLGLVYGLGVLASFLALAVLAVGVQKAGGVANWGDAIRNPHVQLAMTVLITLVALNLFGVFEVTLGGGAMGAATDLASRQGFGGAFFNGVLATILATPCTAPFLTTALAFAFTQSAATIVAVFLTIGVGLALPFVLICFQPRLLKFLPKPGAWMVRFKVAMGFPVMATAVWLVWVSARDQDAVLRLGLFLVVIACAAWIWGEFGQRSRRGGAFAISLALAVLGYFAIFSGKAEIDWQKWSPEAVDAARRGGHLALVDFTAKSCLNCKINKATSIEIPSTRAKLKQLNAVAFEADYTYEDPAIAQALRQFDRPGVPLVLVYPKDPSKAPEVLPPILTPAIVQGALQRAAD